MAPAEALTVAQVVSSLNSYDGKEITVKGFMTAESENNSIWPSQDAADDLGNDCIALSIPLDVYDRRMHGMNAVVRGTLHVIGPRTVVLNTCSRAILYLSPGSRPMRVARDKG